MVEHALFLIIKNYILLYYETEFYLTFSVALCCGLFFAGIPLSTILSMSINATKNSKKELEIENQKKAEDPKL